MSRPGYWQSRGTPEVAITAMTDGHLRNAIRMMARRFLEFEPLPTDNDFARRAKLAQSRWYVTKLNELIPEARRRTILPALPVQTEGQPNTPIPSLADTCRIARDWRTASDPVVIDAALLEGPTTTGTGTVVRIQRPAGAGNALTTTAADRDILNTLTEAAAARPPRQLGQFLNVIIEVEEVLGKPVFGLEDTQPRPTRLISMDL